MEQDTAFEDRVVAKVEHDPSGWAITREDGWSFWVPAEHGVEPHVGDRARFYGDGIGSSVRGLTLNGRVVFYRTEAEERADHDRRIAALPDVFQRRLRKFQKASPDFRWRHEDYELMCCEQAVLFADTLKTVEAIEAFHKADWDEQKRRMPGLDEGHSGNSFDFSCRLARSYLTDPEWVYRDHGALAILTGCEDYVCPHPIPALAAGAPAVPSGE